MSQKSQAAKGERRKSLNRSQASQSQTQTQHLSEEDFKELAADVVKYILHRHFENKVVRKSKLREDVIKGKTRKFDELMEKVANRFDKCFGMKLVSMGEGDKKAFTLMNKLEEKDGDLSLNNNPAELAKQGFLSLILAYLYMTKEPVREERMYRFLREIGILENDLCFVHDELGDIRHLLTKEFVEMMYISYKEQPSSTNDPDDKIKVFQWGERARATIRKKDVFQLMGKIYNCSPDRWKDLYQDVEDGPSESEDESEAEEPSTVE